ncbi:hypothetical protein [Mucilaginibacter sp.]
MTVFVIDTVTPAAFIVDILYLCSILLVFKQDRKTIISLSTAACLLIFATAMFFNHRQSLNLSEWINRGIAVLAILIVSYITIRYQKSNQAAKVKDQQYLKDLKEMLFITSHKVRKPVANIIGLIGDLTNTEANFSTDDLKQHYAYLQFSANELDNFVRELNIFIELTEKHTQV